MNIKIMPLFVVSVLLLSFTSGKFISQLYSVFANGFSIVYTSVTVSLIISVIAFFTVNLYLFSCIKSGLLSNSGFNAIYIIVIIYHLVMLLPVLSQLFFIKLWGAEHTQILGIQNPNDHSMIYMFLQLVLLIFLLRYLKNSVKDKGITL